MQPRRFKTVPTSRVRVESPVDLFHRMMADAATEQFNYTAWVCDMREFEFETELFPRAALEAYTAANMGWEVKPEWDSWFSAMRGGSQGDYRYAMAPKIGNVVDCLVNFPRSKRAVIDVPNTPLVHHGDTNEAKCLREVHFYQDTDLASGDAVLNMTAIFRAQAAEIFPKNVHFLGTMLREVAARTGFGVGGMYYHATRLVRSRSD
jgi:thymidylate synthase